MANKPTGTQLPNGSTFMEITPSNPHAAPIIDLSKRPAFNEQIPVPLKKGQAPTPLIVPAEAPGPLHAVDDSVHPGDYQRPGYDPTSRT